MKPPLILNHPGIQMRLSEFPGDENLISVEVAGRVTPGVVDASVIEARTLRVLGNDEVLRWLDSE